jgi:hypothetical protein
MSLLVLHQLSPEGLHAGDCFPELVIQAGNGFLVLNHEREQVVVNAFCLYVKIYG